MHTASADARHTIQPPWGETGAALLVRANSTRNPPVLQHLPEGSYRSELDGLPVRIIEPRWPSPAPTAPASATATG